MKRLERREELLYLIKSRKNNKNGENEKEFNKEKYTTRSENCRKTFSCLSALHFELVINCISFSLLFYE